MADQPTTAEAPPDPAAPTCLTCKRPMERATVEVEMSYGKRRMPGWRCGPCDCERVDPKPEALAAKVSVS